jgi:hypothetical protein
VISYTFLIHIYSYTNNTFLMFAAGQIVSDLAKKGYSALLHGDDFSEGHVSIHPM